MRLTNYRFDDHLQVSGPRLSASWFPGNTFNAHQRRNFAILKSCNDFIGGGRQLKHLRLGSLRKYQMGVVRVFPQTSGYFSTIR